MANASVTIADALAGSSLLEGADAQVDTEVLLCWALRCDRTFLRTWPDKLIEPGQLQRFQAALLERQKGRPVAHITGSQAFWTIELKVSPATLIPRQDTETLIEVVLELNLPKSEIALLDLGTGTGAIALSLAREMPAWRVTGLDYSDEIVALARDNAAFNSITNARFLKSDWFDGLDAGVDRFEVIVSNPPYIASDDLHLEQGDLRFEAKTALVAQQGGYQDLAHIIEHAQEYGSESGFWLCLEHGFEQGASVRDLMLKQGYQKVETKKDLPGNDRVTLGFYPKQ